MGSARSRGGVVNGLPAQKARPNRRQGGLSRLHRACARVLHRERCPEAPAGSTRSSSTATASRCTSRTPRSAFTPVGAMTGPIVSRRSRTRPGTSAQVPRSSTARSWSRPPTAPPTSRTQGQVDQDRHGRVRPALSQRLRSAEAAPDRARWVEPELRAEIEYRAKSAEGKVRHPFFKGLREDL